MLSKRTRSVLGGILRVGAAASCLSAVAAWKTGKFLVKTMTGGGPYRAKDGRIYCHRESPREYEARTTGQLLNRATRSEGPYRARDGRVYSHRESPTEYEARKRQESLRYIQEVRRRHEVKLRQQKEIEAARDDVVRAAHGCTPGQGYVAKDGKVYDHKETPEEWQARKLRNLRRQAEDARRQYDRKKGLSGQP